MELFHLVNRGVEKRKIVLNDADKLRFVQNLFILNDAHLAPNNRLSRNKRSEGRHERTPLVHIHAWCLMDNHYHMIVSPANGDIDNISKFMQKFNMGYAKYFNEKYKRSGYLWQGKYRKILIEQDGHFLHIPYYVHCNPLDYKFKEWRQGKVKEVESALEYLREYRWSSHLDYLGIKNFPSVIDMDLLGGKSGVLGTPKEYEVSISSLIKDREIASKNTLIEYD